MIAALSIAAVACLAVGQDSDRILVRDLAPAYPELAAVEASTPLAYAPAPGVTRVFHASDLRALAARFALPTLPDRDICVTRPVAPLDPSRLLAAMRGALPDARIEILDYSRQPAPAGEIEFRREGLREGALWRGAVRYAGNRRFPIWARVRAVSDVQRVVAMGDLKARQPIAGGQVVVRTREEFPASVSFAQTPAEVVGRSPRLFIRAGTDIRIDQLETPWAVTRGDTVRVQVYGGAAHLDFEGIAESSGAVDQTILVRNPSSGKSFRARIDGPGSVSVGNKGAS